MDALHIQRLEARYHLPPRRAGEKRRLDRLLEEVAEHRLEAALERLGVPAQEEVCLREVHVPVRLRLSGPDAELALDWSLAFARAVAEAWRRGGPGVVRYPSRAQALADFAAGVARQDLRRAWAWRQMELTEVADGASPEEAASALVTTLEREGAFVVPVLAAVARAGLLDGLARRLPAPAWPRLARAALAAAGAAAAELLEAPWSPSGEAGLPGEPRDPSTFPAEPRAERALERSALAAAAVRILPGLRTPPTLVRSLAVLAILEADPGFFRRNAPEVRRRVAAESLRLAAAPEPEAEPEDSAAEARPWNPARSETARVPGRTVAAPSGSGRSATPVPAAAEPPRTSAAEGTSAAGAEAVSEEDELAGLPRQRGFTHAGGLLFLLGLVEELGLPAAAGLFRRRSLRWVLHRLAVSLAHVGEADPAALAFAGLGPEEEPPSTRQEPPSEAEVERLEGFRQRLAAALAKKLERPEAAPEALFAEVCHRRAEIVADPGWLEIHLSLDEVTTDVRRCGLDLDPGYLPWLGAVVRFFYA